MSGMGWRDQPVALAMRPLGDAGLGLLDLASVIAAGSSAPVLLQDRACREVIAAHVASEAVELGGLLIGTAWSLAPESADAPPLLLRVETAVPALEAQSTEVSLRMDVELWSRAQAEAARREGIIIGWYHSHPDLGAFFSGTDRRTQRAVFHHPYSVGLVVDPARGEERWFLGPECREITRSGEFDASEASLERMEGDME
jgi:proteasome lid subunit RPN8/RPN11